MRSLGGPKRSRFNLSFVFALLLTLAGMRVAYAAESSDVFAIDSICTNDATQAGKYGKRSCSAVLANTKDVFSKGVKNIIAHYYDGRLVEPDFRDTPNSSGFCQTVDAAKNPIAVKKAVCNIADPQLPGGANGAGGEDNVNWNGEACVTGNVDSVSKGYCDFRTVALNSKIAMDQLCPKEMKWFQSARPQVWQKVHYELFKEVQDTGQVRLTKASDNSMACQPFLDEVQHLMNGDLSDPAKPVIGLKALEQKLQQLNESGHPDFQFDPSQGCLRANKTLQNEADIQDSVQQLFNDPADGILSEKKRVSQSVCYLQYARLGAEFLFNRLLMCEFKVRSEKAYLDFYTSSNAIFGELVDGILASCKSYAQTRCEDSMQAGQSVWTNSCARSAFYECYINGTGSSVSQGYGGVRGYFKRKIQERISFPSNEGLFPFEKIKDKDGNLPGLEKCALFLAPFGWLRKRHGRKRRKKAGSVLKVLGGLCLVLAIAAMFFSQGALAAIPTVTAELSCPDGSVVEVRPSASCSSQAQIEACKAGYDREHADSMAKADASIAQTDSHIASCGVAPTNTFTSAKICNTVSYNPVCESNDFQACSDSKSAQGSRMSDFIDSLHAWPSDLCTPRVAIVASQLTLKSLLDFMVGPAMRDNQCTTNGVSGEEDMIMKAPDVLEAGLMACLEDAMKNAGSACPLPAQDPPPPGTLAQGDLNGPPKPWTDAREALSEMLEKHDKKFNAQSQVKDSKATAAYKALGDGAKNSGANGGNSAGAQTGANNDASRSPFGVAKTFGGNLAPTGEPADAPTGEKKEDLVYGNMPIGTGFEFSAANAGKEMTSNRSPATSDGDAQLESPNGSVLDVNLAQKNNDAHNVNADGFYGADESIFAVIHRRYGKVSPRFE